MISWVKSRTPAAILVLCGLQLGVLAHAQQRLTVDDAVREALESHPVLAVQTQRIQSITGQVQQAGLRLNPRLFIQSENWNVGNANKIGRAHV